MENMTPGSSRSWRSPLTAAVLFGYTVLLHRTSLSLTFNTDAFSILYPIHMSGIRGCLEWTGTYHYFPVTMIWLWVQYLLFGLNEPAYQVMNIIQHGIIVVMVFGLALEMTGKRLVALIAAVLFSGAAGYHEVLYWSIVGNNYHVSTFFYLLGMYCFVKYLKLDSAHFYTLFCVCVGCALLSHELTLSLVPACVVYYLFLHVCSDDRLAFWQHWRGRNPWSRLGRLLIAPGILIAMFLAMKAVMSLRTDVLGEPHHLSDSCYLFVRGVVSALMLRGDSDAVSFVVNVFGGPQLAWLYILIGAPAFIFCFLYWFNRLERVLVLWLLGQLLLTQIAIGISSRHLYLPTVAGSILIGSLVVRLYDLAAARFLLHKRPVLRTATIVCVAVVLGYVLAVLPHADCRKAEMVWFEPHRANLSLRATISKALATASATPTLYILNATRYMVRDGVFVWTFQNGLRDSIEMHFPGVFGRVRLGHLFETSNVPNGSRFVDPGTFDTSVLEGRDYVVVLFVPERNEFIQATLSLLSGGSVASSVMRGVPSVYTPESAPDLDWIEGGQPWLNLPPDEELDFAFESPGGSDRWLVVFYLAEEGREMLVAASGEPVGTLSSVPGGAPGWTHVALPFPADPQREATKTEVKLRSVGSSPANVARVGLLTPQASYDSQSTRAFHWGVDGLLALPNGHEMSVPVVGCGQEICRLFVTYSADDDRRLRVTTDRGQVPKLEVIHNSEGWVTATAALDSGEITVVTFRAIGSAPARILEFGLESIRSGES